MCIVVVGVMWSFGFLGLLRYEITVLTALVPTLMIVIGIPNCIFLTNKYHQECRIHGNQAKALVRVITKVGTPTLITNLTTSFGFATFIVTNNELLSYVSEFLRLEHFFEPIHQKIYNAIEKITENLII
jgi:predicted RND superfamily exporter protein